MLRTDEMLAVLRPTARPAAFSAPCGKIVADQLPDGYVGMRTVPITVAPAHLAGCPASELTEPRTPRMPSAWPTSRWAIWEVRCRGYWGPGNSAEDERTRSADDFREQMRRMRSLPVEQIVADVLFNQLNAAQVKLGRRDAGC